MNLGFYTASGMPFYTDFSLCSVRFITDFDAYYRYSSTYIYIYEYQNSKGEKIKLLIYVRV